MTAKESDTPVIDLSRAPGARSSWDRPPGVVALWSLVELLALRNPFQVSSALRAAALRLFGARIGRGVILRPGLRVRFPWKLEIGDRSWVGEDVWIHNQDRVVLGHDVVVSQSSFLTTGSHRHRRDMALITAPISIESGAWVTARCIVLGGTVIGRSSIVTPQSVVRGAVAPNSVMTGNPAVLVGTRFDGSNPAKRSDSNR